MNAHALDAVAGGPGIHRREHTSVLAAAEKRLLVWIAQRLPLAITADRLTALGAAAIVGVAASFAAAPYSRWALLGVPFFLALNWFGDSLDGTVARVRNQQRPRYGFYVDHVVDIANATILFGGLSVSGLASPWIAAGLLVGYLLLCAESFLATHALGVFTISFSGFGPTELRILLSIGAVVAIWRPVVRPFGLADYWLFDVGGLIGTIAMLIVFVISAVRNARTLYRAEPLTGGAR
jgi:archaetidylinositol phosphate synthase